MPSLVVTSTSGAPQNPNLGLLLFLLSTNDLIYQIDCFKHKRPENN